MNMYIHWQSSAVATLRFSMALVLIPPFITSCDFISLWFHNISKLVRIYFTCHLECV